MFPFSPGELLFVHNNNNDDVNSKMAKENAIKVKVKVNLCYTKPKHLTFAGNKQGHPLLLDGL